MRLTTSLLSWGKVVWLCCAGSTLAPESHKKNAYGRKTLVSLFYCIVVPSKASSWKLMLDLDFCAETDFCCPRFWALFTAEKLKNSEKNHASSSYMYATFISLDFSHLSNLSASKKFVFTDCSVFDRFCLLFRILSFTVFEWISLLHKISVAVANVQKCWRWLCHYRTCEFLIMH